MILKTTEIISILQGQFVLDCPTLVLKPNLKSKNSNDYLGSGTLSFPTTGQVDIKQLSPNAMSFEEIFESLDWKAGKIIGDQFYYDINATDIKGRIWEAKRILPQKNAGQAGTVILGKAPQVVSKTQIPSPTKKNYLRIIFGTNVNLPSNIIVKTEKKVDGETREWDSKLSASKFSSCGIEFEVERDSSSTVVMAYSDRHFSENVIISIIDTISFVVSTVHTWSIVELRQDAVDEVRLRGPMKEVKKSRIEPPVSLIESTENVWQLFDKYLSYGLGEDHSESHPIGPLVRSVIASGKSSLEVEALTLSVSVESLLTKHFDNFLDEDTELADNILKAKKIITDSKDLSEDFKQRLIGSITSINNRRAKDYLFAMRDRGLIDGDLVKTYSSLRNRFAHGENINWTELQSLINHCRAVLVLFYQLIFLRIGYTGLYVDYSEYGYPQREYKSKLA